MIDDIKIKYNNLDFSCRSCAIIINENKILFQKRSGDKYWALPGGKIKYGESSFDAIVRELNEELAIDNIINTEFVDMNEYFFEISDILFHQFIFTYIVYLNDYTIINKNMHEKLLGNNNLIFKWLDLNKIDWEQIKPKDLKEQISGGKVKKLSRIIREV